MNKLIKNLIILFFTLFCFSSIVNAKDIRFIQATDVHLTRNNKEYLEAFVNEINTNHKDIDFVVFTGDNIDVADTKMLEQFLDIVKNIKVKTYIVLGNHDLSKAHDLTAKEYMPLVKKKLGKYHSDKPNYVFKQDKTVFIVMNGVKEVITSPGGYFRQSELEWLDKQLTKYKKYNVIILQHFPLLQARSASDNLYRKECYLEVLKKHNNVKAIVSGHYHTNREEYKFGVYNIVSPNFNNNNAYKIIEIGEDGFVYTNLIDKSTPIVD